MIYTEDFDIFDSLEYEENLERISLVYTDLELIRESFTVSAGSYPAQFLHAVYLSIIYNVPVESIYKYMLKGLERITDEKAKSLIPPTTNRHLKTLASQEIRLIVQNELKRSYRHFISQFSETNQKYNFYSESIENSLIYIHLYSRQIILDLRALAASLNYYKGFHWWILLDNNKKQEMLIRGNQIHTFAN